jgi:RNA polymerase sigma factor (sigma-70 family)
MVNETILDIAMNHADSLILRAQSGDREAFNKLVNLWYKRIYNYCFKYAGSHDIAMDITQNTFISVHKNLGQLKQASSFKSWLYRIAFNCSHEETRKIKRTEGDHFEILDNGIAKSAAFSTEMQSQPDEKIQRQELSEIIMKALANLKEEQRVVVIMKEYEGLKFREIADILDISENTAKSRLYYGLKHLKSMLLKVNYNNQSI